MAGRAVAHGSAYTFLIFHFHFHFDFLFQRTSFKSMPLGRPSSTTVLHSHHPFDIVVDFLVASCNRITYPPHTQRAPAPAKPRSAVDRWRSSCRRGPVVKIELLNNFCHTNLLLLFISVFGARCQVPPLFWLTVKKSQTWGWVSSQLVPRLISIIMHNSTNLLSKFLYFWFVVCLLFVVPLTRWAHFPLKSCAGIFGRGLAFCFIFCHIVAARLSYFIFLRGVCDSLHRAATLICVVLAILPSAPQGVFDVCTGWNNKIPTRRCKSFRNLRWGSGGMVVW